MMHFVRKKQLYERCHQATFFLSESLDNFGDRLYVVDVIVYFFLQTQSELKKFDFKKGKKSLRNHPK